MASVDQSSPVEAVAIETSWVPADACQLPTAEQPARLAAFADVFASDVRSLERLDETRLRLDLAPAPAVAARVASLAQSEADCCGFFTFRLSATQEQLTLEISVPSARVNVLEGVAAQAQEAFRGR